MQKVGADDRDFADILRRGHFAMKHKRRGASLGRALDDLPPPLVSNLNVTQVHTSFIGTARRTYTLTLVELASTGRPLKQ